MYLFVVLPSRQHLLVFVTKSLPFSMIRKLKGNIKDEANMDYRMAHPQGSIPLQQVWNQKKRLSGGLRGGI